MAARNRVAVPELPPPGAAGEPGEVFGDEFGTVVPFEHPGLDLFRETGDMAALQDAHFNDWSWTVYRLRNMEDVQRAGTRQTRAFVTRTVGPFDVVALQQACGGGLYEIRGSFGGHLRIRHILEIEGPRKSYDAQPRPFQAPGEPSRYVSDTSDAVLRMLDQQGRLLERLQDRLANPPAATAAPAAAPAAAPIGIADVIALADRMNQREVPTPTGDMVKQIMDVMRMGMDLKGEITGGPELSTAERLADRVLPSLERIAIGIFTARGGGARGPRPGGVEPAPGTSSLPTPPPILHRDASAAEVVAVETPAAPAEPPDSYRWKSAIEAVANAIAREDDPRDFAADVLELLLPDDDLAMLRAAPDDMVITRLRSAAGGALPVLETPAADAFMRAMLAELREPSEVDES